MALPLVLTIVLLAGNPAAAGEEIAIAVAGPMSGRYAAFGQQMKAGAELAVADLEDGGGVLGRRIRLHVADDACERARAAGAAAALVSRGVVFVAGHFCAGAALAASPVYAAAGAIHIAPGRDLVRPAGEDGAPVSTLFVLAGRDRDQGEVAGRHLARRFAGRRIAVVHDRTLYGRSLAAAAREALGDGGQLALFAAIAPGEKDYAELVSRLEVAAADVLYFAGHAAEAAIILRQMRERRLDTVLLGPDTLSDPAFVQIAGPAAEGTLLTFPADGAVGARAQDVARRLRLRGRAAGAIALATYAAVEAWARAAAAAASLASADIAAALYAGVHDTILGPVAFDARGNGSMPLYAVHRWRSGTLEQVD